jgi:hypothetical protein
VCLLCSLACGVDKASIMGFVVSKDVALFSNRNAEITKSRSEVDDLINSSPRSDEF